MEIPEQTRPDSPEGDKRALSGEWKVPMTQPLGFAHAHKYLHIPTSAVTHQRRETNGRMVPAVNAYWSSVKGAGLDINGWLLSKRPRFDFPHGEKFRSSSRSQDNL
jgi:hypothetical protein